MNFRTSRVKRAATVAFASLLMTAGLVAVTDAPALATAHCSSSGQPISTSGKFRNSTSGTIMVKGDKLVGGVFKTVEYAIGPGTTAWGSAGICDADFIKTYWDWYYINTIVDGDTYQKITFSWSCWDSPGTGFHIACGAG